ncbi:MAG: hypothetical protein JXA11_02360 [Phycisphaerae bacterium]|nr:hypothetical protein [Phycisphaerae bacterium]
MTRIPFRHGSILAYTMIFFGGSVIFADSKNDGWDIVYREDFNTSKHLARRGWGFDPKVFQVRSDGERGCLEVNFSGKTSPSQFAVYRQVLQRDKEYRVRAKLRAQGVRAHPEGRYNRGAVVFGAFYSKDQTWVNGGAYPHGLHAAGDWEEITAGPMSLFPSQAHYVQIMLGIEGCGRASFDWVVLEQRDNTAAPTLRSPANAEIVRTRRPTFRWTSPVEHCDVAVQLRRSPNQADTKGFDFLDFKKDTAGLLTANSPLDAGMWYWRVRERFTKIDTFHDSPWSSFTVPDHASDEKISDSPTTILIVTKDDSSPRRENDRLNAETDSLVEPDENGNLRVDGKPFFPIGTYRMENPELLARAGFNLVHDYTFESTDENFRKKHGDASRAEVARSYLQAAHKAGLKVFMGLPREKINDYDETFLQNFVAELRNEPALLAWYLYDEPAVQRVGMHRLWKLRKAISDVDPRHPTTLVLCRPELSGIYGQACDILWVDPYPLDHTPAEPLEMVSDWVNQARSLLPKRQPVWVVIGAHDIRYWNNPEDALKKLGPPDRPSHEQLRCMTHLALSAGAKGILYFWPDTKKYDIQKDTPKIWENLIRVVGELRSLQPFLPAGTRSEPVPEPLRSWSAEANGQKILTLINPQDKTASVPASRLKQLLPPNQIEENTQLEFAPHEVKVFRWDIPKE